MIKTKKQLFTVILVIVLLMILSTTSYAFFNYTRTGANNELLVGNIYFNHTQGNSINLVDEFPEKKEVARERNDNVIPVTITGYNESEKDIYYKLMISHGDEVSGRTRIDDKFLRFDLIEELANNEERYIVFNESFDTINNTILVKNRIDAGTSPSNSVSITYQLRMWISDDILISDTNEDADYSTSEYENLFASIKITAKGDTENVYYYSSFDDAVTAINSESYSSDTTRNLAKVGIYTDSDDNSTNLVFYDDVESSSFYELHKPVDINLYGHSYNDITTETAYTGFDIYADFSMVNGVVNSRSEDENHNFFLYVDNASAVVNNIDLHSAPWTGDTQYRGTFFDVVTGGSFIVKNSKFNAIDLESYSTGKLTISNVDAVGWIYSGENGNIEVNDSYFYNEKSYLAIVSTNGFMEVNNSTLFSDSPGCYHDVNDYYYADSLGIMNSGTLIFNSGYVFGTHSAIQTNNGSKTYVYGGTFESTDHGGFYFSQGPTGIAYIENANIGGINYPAEGKLRPNGRVSSIEHDGVTYTLEEGRVAFYSGGSSAQNGESTYIVNSNIYAMGGEIIVIRSSTPQQSVYFSGTRFTNTRSDQHIRLQNYNTMRLYLGSGNDFGLVDKVYNNGAKVPFDEARAAGAIIDTNANYKDIVKPE